MSSLLSSFGGSTGGSVDVMGHPEQGGDTNFGQNQRLGQIQQPGSGALGGLLGNPSPYGSQDFSGAFGQLLGQLLRGQLGQSSAGQFGLGALGLGMGNGLKNQAPQIGSAYQDPSHSISISTILSALCLAPDAPLDTPVGPQPIRNLSAGQLVLSKDQDGRPYYRPILFIRGIVVPSSHELIEVRGPTGPFWVTPAHPLANGEPCDSIGRERQTGRTTETYDLIVDSDTGLYSVCGVWLRSTIDPRHRQEVAA